MGGVGQEMKGEQRSGHNSTSSIRRSPMYISTKQEKKEYLVSCYNVLNTSLGDRGAEGKGREEEQTLGQEVSSSISRSPL